MIIIFPEENSSSSLNTAVAGTFCQRVCHSQRGIQAVQAPGCGNFPRHAFGSLRRHALALVRHVISRVEIDARAHAHGSFRIAAHRSGDSVLAAVRLACARRLQQADSSGHGGIVKMRKLTLENSKTVSTPPITQHIHGERNRLVTIFGRFDDEGRRRVCYVYDTGNPEYVATEVDGEQPVGSIATHNPAASWHEREVCDQYGIDFTGSPDARPLMLHENWPAGFHPMVDALPEPTPPGSESQAPVANEYRFLRVQGDGITEVAVGPVHAGIIEPPCPRYAPRCGPPSRSRSECSAPRPRVGRGQPLARA